ncbi:acetate--CoA ligase family protein [Brevibacterium linens]|uniref:Acyl-CoA synthetase (NDP forming) n=1 Tax=Brevibacterium linens ATCC 9172 TaxID=1255617 RepID=A0A2H1HVZ4_BRELN|nr:acetate--CoA ligase family protein [Brevibacterium linens]KAB1949972.1 acetate--CoA ligase family protein [Brevibacterium linens ATCC 9172]SMX67087.1 Acyl-CoA synthetase (NDP forming) [Brevibacterium linens ATCC 9172]
MDAFFDPGSVAVLGASNDSSKWGFWLAAGALRGSERRRVYLINATAASIQGRPTYARLSDLPETPELLVISVPGPTVAAVVAEALENGVRAFLIISARVPDADALAATIRQAGGRLIGPNSLGLVDSHADLLLAWGNFTPGSLAVVTQSGQLGTEIATLAARSGLGISRFASIGGQSDVRAAEVLTTLVDDPATAQVALYLESFTGGAALVSALKALRAAGKPTMILTTGASNAGARLARSHTGSMTTAMDTIDAACRAAGSIRLTTPGQLVELAGFFASAWLPNGPRIGVLSDSGGQGAIAADTAESWGLNVTELTPTTRQRAAGILTDADHIDNPIDLDGAGEKNLDVYADLAEVLLTDTDIDAVVLSGYFGCYGEDVPDLIDRELAVVDRLGDLVAEAKKPVIVHSMSASSPAVTRLWELGVPVCTSIEAAMRVLARADFYAAHSGRLTEPLELTGPVTPWGTGYAAARAVIEDAGIPVPAAVTVGSVGPGETRAPTEAVPESGLNPPFALKAGWPAHKTEVGGIALGLNDLHAVETAYADMVGRLGDGEYILEEMDTRDHVVEILVGGRQDENFGPLVIVAAGGTETELFADTWLELAPVTHTEALDMIARLSCSRLLTGWRGRPAADIDALAEVIVAVSRLVAGNNAIAEIEINPVRVAPDGALAVDALVVTTDYPPAENVSAGNVSAENPNSED